MNQMTVPRHPPNGDPRGYRAVLQTSAAHGHRLDQWGPTQCSGKPRPSRLPTTRACAHTTHTDTRAQTHTHNRHTHVHARDSFAHMHMRTHNTHVLAHRHTRAHTTHMCTHNRRTCTHTDTHTLFSSGCLTFLLLPLGFSVLVLAQLSLMCPFRKLLPS